MAEKHSNEQDVLQIFKSKVEEAVGMVALIPDAQRRQLHDFWNVISSTINPLNKSDNIDNTKTDAGSIEETSDSQRKNDKLVTSTQQESDNAAINQSNKTDIHRKESSSGGQTSEVIEQGTSNETGQLVSVDIQDYLDLVSTSNQNTGPQAVTSTIISQGLSVAPFPEDTSVHFINTTNETPVQLSNITEPISSAGQDQLTNTTCQQEVTLDDGDHYDDEDVTNEDVSDTSYLDNQDNVIRIAALPEDAPSKDNMVSILKKDVAAPTEIMCEVREDSQTIEIHLPPDFAEGDILTPEKLSMLLQGQFQTYSPVKMEQSSLEYQFVDDSISESTHAVENVVKDDHKNDPQVFHEQAGNNNKSTKNGYNEVLHEISDNQHPKEHSSIPGSYNTQSGRGTKKRKRAIPSSSERVSKRIKQKKDSDLMEGEILTPDKVLDYLYGDEIDKEIDDKGQEVSDEDVKKLSSKGRRSRRSVRVKPEFRQPRPPRIRAEKNKEATEVSLECKICGVQLSNSGALLVHQRKHTGARPFPCTKCDKTFTTKQNMKRHELSHTGEKPFTCDLCEKSFTEKKSLVIHKRTHTGEKPYVCPTCGRAFTQSVTLHTHMMIHTGDKKHLCEECGKSFRQRANLLSHRKRHLQEKTFNCPDCSFSFFTKGELERHLLRHTGEKPFQCDICPKRFTRQQYLNEHLNIHIGNKPYSCDKCEEKFHDQSTYHRHLKKHKAQEVKQEVVEPVSNEEEPKETTTTTYVMETNNLLGSDALEQLQAVINNEVEKIQQQTGTNQQYQTVILKGSSAQPVDEDKDKDADQVYQITMVDQSQEVVATVDFSAFNLLANATAKQYAISSE
ncbi:uncharacterized protein [Argopecten irradians]|uniref:uncharacterized protein isoform X1 n=2 Tax=Argopecten irradians TaxID=31199 RepID=UPI003718E248